VKAKRSKADAMFSDWIRERDRWTCQRCGKTYPPPTFALHCAHMFGRGKQNTRFDPANARALCYGCHRWLDTHPDLKREFFREWLGVKAFDLLEFRSNQSARGVRLSDVIR
jgi:hypothetical protein